MSVCLFTTLLDGCALSGLHSLRSLDYQAQTISRLAGAKRVSLYYYSPYQKA